MAQPKYDIISVSLSQKIGDEVSASATDGQVYKSADRLKAINRAIGNVYTQLLTQLQEQQFMSQYPEYCATMTCAFTSNVMTTSMAGVRKFIKFATATLKIEAIPFEQVADALMNPYSVWKPSATKMRFTEINNSVTLYPTENAVTSATGYFLKQPVDITHGGSDTDIPYAWLDLVATESARIIFNSQQIM